jgi:hypothetical protein
MKKLLVLLVVLAITMISSMAFAAAEITVGGSVDIRSRAFNNLDTNADNPDSDRDTQTRVRVNVDAKAGDAKARIQIQRDWEQWGGTGGFANTGVAVDNGPFEQIRESWLDFPLFGGVRLKAGHMLLALGNSWFLRNMRNGDDAWVAYTDIDSLHLGLVDAKIANAAHNNDSDFYALVAAQKLGDMGTVGLNFSHIVLAKEHVISATAGSDTLQNLGLHAALKLGPVNLKGEVDLQMGEYEGDPADPIGDPAFDYKGNQIVIEGNMAMDPVTVNFTLARGSGVSAGDTDMKEFIPVQDVDPHYTLLYEYKIRTAAALDPYGFGAETGKHTGFANTTALSVGADVKLGSVTVGGSAWLLMATEDTNIGGAQDAFGNDILSDDLGIEIDAKVNWKISDNVSWNWTLGYFVPGDAYKQTDPLTGLPKDGDVSTGVQGILSMKF